MADGIRFGPTPAIALRRSGLIVLAVAIVGLASWALQGPPSKSRELRRQPPYGPSLPLGVSQFALQGALFGAEVHVARRWLKVKL